MNRVLIVSANALSNKSNNGLTISSIINCMEAEEVFQIFIHREIPVPYCHGHFYRITDGDVLDSFLKQTKSGEVVEEKETDLQEKSVQKKTVKPSEPNRIMREIIWKTKNWKSKKFAQWLDAVNPDLVFFVAGDFIGLYDVYHYVTAFKPSVQKIIYVTDDYLLRRSDVLFNVRRHFIEKQFIRCIGECNLFLTISEKMRETYHCLYGVDSTVISNISENLNMETKHLAKQELVLIYAGGLHYGRDRVLYEFAKRLNSTSAKLLIYTHLGAVDEKSIQKLQKLECVQLHDSVPRNELIRQYAQADILVFVESFEQRYTECTRLSFSTKISEYLSMNKMILAIGSTEAASIDYLSDCALICHSFNQIEGCITDMLNETKRKMYAEKAYKKYKMNHDRDMLETRIRNALNQLG